MRRPERQRTGPRGAAQPTYPATEDAAATEAKITAAGGPVSLPMTDVSGVGTTGDPASGIGGLPADTSADTPAEVPARWGVYFGVRDTDATVADAREPAAPSSTARTGGWPGSPTTRARSSP